MTITQQRQQPDYCTLALIAQALKFAYTDHYDVLAATTKTGKALPGRAGALADQLLTLCVKDTDKLGKLIRQAGVDDAPLYQAIHDAQDLVQEMIETAMVLSTRIHAENPDLYTAGVVELREILRSLRAGEVASVAPQQFEGLVRTGMLHPQSL